MAIKTNYHKTHYIKIIIALLSTWKNADFFGVIKAKKKLHNKNALAALWVSAKMYIWKVITVNYLIEALKCTRQLNFKWLKKPS